LHGRRILGWGRDAAIGEAGRAAIGLTDGMVRISAGIEDVDDLLEDLEQALSVL
jgi:cystathionine beta-lyase/cystathionine gamma-synthase